jgi:hypothetical protein
VTRVAAAADGSDVDQRVDAGMLKVVASSRGRRRRIVCAAENEKLVKRSPFHEGVQCLQGGVDHRPAGP